MGLDVTAYSALKFVGAEVGEDEADERNLVHLYDNRGLPSRLDGQSPGYYEQPPDGKEHHFYAGSYGGYNHWRAELSRGMHGVPPESFWSGGERDVRGGAFAELIHFSDCEGAIGPVTCRKLAADFAENAERAEAHAKALGEWGGVWLEKYGEWRTAFELASDGGGFVRLH